MESTWKVAVRQRKKVATRKQLQTPTQKSNPKHNEPPKKALQKRERE